VERAGQPILAADGIQLALAGQDTFPFSRKSRLKGGCGQNCPPHMAASRKKLHDCGTCFSLLFNEQAKAYSTRVDRSMKILCTLRMQSCPTTDKIVLMTSRAPELNLFYPLNEFYDQAALPLPTIARVAARDVPEPYNSLLVHARDMTPTLADAYGRGIQLRVLKHMLRGDVFSRQIVLVLEGDQKPVVFGAIKIYLQDFSDEARRLVLEMKQPLGTILQTQNIAHTSQPEAYIKVTADVAIGSALGLTGSPLLYGRRNALWNSSQQALAQVVEILPPATF